MGMANAKPVATPLSSREVRDMATVIDDTGRIAHEDYMGEDDATKYMGIAARANYLSLDRMDLLQSCRCMCAQMSRPLKACFQMKSISQRPPLLPFHVISCSKHI